MVLEKSSADFFEKELEGDSEATSDNVKLQVDMYASALTYAYLDWFAGDYPALTERDLIDTFQTMVEAV